MLNRENGRLRRELEWSQGLKATVRRLTDEAGLLRGELAGYHDQMDIIAEQSREAFHLRMALMKSDIKKQELEARLAERPRWHRGCFCASSPLEAVASPSPRLFRGTLFGTSFRARFLFGHCACLRPLCRIAAWYADQGLAVSPGTLANSMKRFVPLFDPLYEAILAHRNRTVVRHADETGWRVQEFRDNGRSSRAWLWTSVSRDAVCFHIGPSRSAEVAKTLFGDTACTVFVVCDRYSACKTLARELAGKVILCWSHQRRDFIECAAG